MRSRWPFLSSASSDKTAASQPAPGSADARADIRRAQEVAQKRLDAASRPRPTRRSLGARRRPRSARDCRAPGSRLARSSASTSSSSTSSNGWMLRGGSEQAAEKGARRLAGVSPRLPLLGADRRCSCALRCRHRRRPHRQRCVAADAVRAVSATKWGTRSSGEPGRGALAAEAAESAVGTPTAATFEWRARTQPRFRARVDDATRELIDIASRNAREEGEAAWEHHAISRRAQARRRRQCRHAVPRRARGGPRRYRDAAGRARQGDRAGEPHLGSDARAARGGRVAAWRRRENAPPAKGEDPATREARIVAASLARRRAEARVVHADSALGIELLKQNELLLDGERSTWEARAAAISTRMIRSRRALFEASSSPRSRRCARGRSSLRQQLAAATTRAQEQEAKLRTLSGDDAGPRPDHPRLVPSSAKRPAPRARPRCCRSSGCCGISATISRVGARIPSPNGCAGARGDVALDPPDLELRGYDGRRFPAKPPTAAGSPSRAA